MWLTPVILAPKGQLVQAYPQLYETLSQKLKNMKIPTNQQQNGASTGEAEVERVTRTSPGF